ncbi:uncharacterized protein B0I36DRAFT_384983 [Microdochium trichocladiopsis]|uniref:Uncharacterized protein n=1 Tax=Microdochium trichocladiopsis TaxID=1682393 RepID=A0A9P9BT52_9PEZI|nr:uncharacterized protein B0I36DRAFT_384983 [Microdochium trichocladiopsis]KAH7029486.1 hypothetical protein B0I36DRAFT_384983 [Microdochium trichocladiopsis]
MAAPPYELVLGKIKPYIILDDPKHVHCGAQDPIRGRVRLVYSSSSHVASDVGLSAPCKIVLTLQGNLKVEIGPSKKQGGGGLQNYYTISMARMFAQPHVVFDDLLPSLRKEYNHGMAADMSRSFDFSVAFPDRILDADCFDRKWGDGKNHKKEKESIVGATRDEDKYDMDPLQPLPPSMMVRKALNFDVPGELSVQYTLTARVEMPGTSVATLIDSVPIIFDRPLDAGAAATGVPASSSEVQKRFGHFAFQAPGLGAGIKNTLLARTSSIFRNGSSSNRPPLHDQDYLLSWQLTCPTEVHRGRPLDIQLQILPGHQEIDSEATPHAMPPVIGLEKVIVDMEILVHGQGEVDERRVLPGGKSRPGQQYAGRGVVVEETLSAQEKSRKEKHSTRAVDGNEDHGDSSSTSGGIGLLHAGNGWARVISLPRITEGLCSSFRTVCIRRAYFVNVRCRVQLPTSRQKVTFQHSFPITVLPPLPPDTTGLSMSELAGYKPGWELGAGQSLRPTAEIDSATLSELEGKKDLKSDDRPAGDQGGRPVELEARPLAMPPEEQHSEAPPLPSYSH